MQCLIILSKKTRVEFLIREQIPSEKCRTNAANFVNVYGELSRVHFKEYSEPKTMEH